MTDETKKVLEEIKAELEEKQDYGFYHYDEPYDFAMGEAIDIVKKHLDELPGDDEVMSEEAIKLMAQEYMEHKERQHENLIKRKIE